jgi:hypothetical protein
MNYKTAKQYAQDLLTQINYVDVFGRNVGLDYQHILICLKKEFPKSNTSIKELQKTAYGMNAQGTRLPARRRSRRILARDFARSLLIQADADDVGLSYLSIRSRVRVRFPEQKLLSLSQMRGHLSRAGIKLPASRPGKKY